MKRLALLTALMLLASVFFTDYALAQSTLRRGFDDLDVDIWTDKDDGSNYYEGDEITIYFRASRDCYVTIYDLDTRGNINLIFPAEPGDNNFIQGDAVYQIPDPWDDYTLTLEGPPGTENIQIVASVDPYPVPDWRGPVSVYNDDAWDFKYDGDNEQFLERVNRRHFPDYGTAYDNVSFYVAPRYYYKPERVECAGDCGQVYIDYPDGCEVYVNGVFWGYAPLYIPSIYLGRHRVTVYWGTSIVYNDWVLIDPWAPYFVYPRPLYVYDYCWTRWYRHHHDWDYWYNGPSRYKYKDNDDFYTYKKPNPRRGYEIVGNDHRKYEKSKTYAVKTSRIEKYKSSYGYDKSTKSFSTAKGAYNKADKGRGFDKGSSGSKGKSGFDDYYGKKPVSKGTTNEGRGTYNKKGSGSTGDYGKSGSGSSGTSIKKQPRSSGSSGKSAPAVKSPGSSGKKSTGSDSGKKSSGSVEKKSSNSGSKSSGSSISKPAPSSSGSKSSGSSGKSGGKSGGNSGSKSGGNSGKKK